MKKKRKKFLKKKKNKKKKKKKKKNGKKKKSKIRTKTARGGVVVVKPAARSTHCLGTAATYRRGGVLGRAGRPTGLPPDPPREKKIKKKRPTGQPPEGGRGAPPSPAARSTPGLG